MERYRPLTTAVESFPKRKRFNPGEKFSFTSMAAAFALAVSLKVPSGFSNGADTVAFPDIVRVAVSPACAPENVTVSQITAWLCVPLGLPLVVADADALTKPDPKFATADALELPPLAEPLASP